MTGLQSARSVTTDPREAVIARFTPMIRNLAGRYAGKGLSVEDLMQEGCLGLLSALNRYQPNSAVQFSTFAHHCILGRIRHFVRDRGDMIRVPACRQENGCPSIPVVPFVSGPFESGNGISEDRLADSVPDFARAIETSMALQEAIDRLPGTLPEIVRAYYFEEEGLDKIGRRYGISRQTAAKRLRKGIDLLKAGFC